MDVRKLTLQKLHFSPLTRAYVNVNDIKNAMESLNIMRQAGFQVNLFDTTSTGIYSLIRKNRKTIDQAYYCLEELRKEGKVVDVSALNVVIAACSNISKRNRYRRDVDMIRALETYKAAEKLGVKPNVETFSSLLLVCLYAKRRDLADQLWKEMLELEIFPTILTYSRMISVICTQNDYEEAFVYLEEMKAKNLLPPRDVYEKIIKRCVHHGDTRALLALEEAESFGHKFSSSFYQDLKSGGLNLELAKKIIGSQKKNFDQQKISSNKNNVKEMPVDNSNIMDEFVDIIASKANKSEQN
jgi:pentatricopeptide repeat protein